MHLFDIINEDNFAMYAMHVYDNPQCTSVDEFNDDLNRFKYLKRLFKRYEVNDDLQERLILNHLIVIYNVFGIEGGHKLTFYKVSRKHWSYLKTFLIYLNYIGDDALPEIPLDTKIVEALRKI
jgi:hypothetical protein